MAEYEWETRVLSFDRGTSRAEIRRALAAEAEYGQWELHRTRIYLGGRMRTWLRRRIIRAPRPGRLA
jgi:hypothetical protein